MARRTKANRQTRYTDDFRSGAVLMLEAAGYPDTKGALSKVSKHLKVPGSTLHRWFHAKQNPAPSQLVNEKRIDLVGKLKDLLHLFADEAAVDVKANGVDGVRAMTAVGILVDKIQLLEGKPTGITETTGAIRITNDIDRSEYEAVVAEAEEIVAQAASGTADTA